MNPAQSTWRIPLVILWMLLLFTAPFGTSAETRFVTAPVFEAKNIAAFASDVGISRGVAWGDMDNDGLVDLVISNTNDQRLFFYRNLGNHQFRKIANGAVAEFRGHAEGLTWADYDNDGWLDLFVATTRGENALFRNLGDGRFDRMRGTGLTEAEASTSMACWADFDNDGYLDVLLATRGTQQDMLFKNIGGRSFKKMDILPPQPDGTDARTCAWGDFDGDRWPDLIIGNFLAQASDGSNRKATNLWYRNIGGTSFRQVQRGLAVNYPALTYGLSAIDFDQDGDLDLFETNIGSADQNILYENIAEDILYPRFDQAVTNHSTGPSKGHSWGDFDLDGILDLAIAEGTEGLTAEDAPYDVHNKLFLGTSSGFTTVKSGDFVVDSHISAGLAWADVDRDGDLDLMVANWGGGGQRNRFYENKSSGNWIAFQLTGTRSNRMGIGTRVALQVVSASDNRSYSRTFWPQTGYASANEPIVHFGLGSLDAGTTIHIELTWPSGTVQKITDIERNVRHHIREP